MRRMIFGILVALASSSTLAGKGVEGVWKTETGEDGGYLEVNIGPCESDANRTCGVISKAHNAQGLSPDYEHLGKLMVKDMMQKGEGQFSGGTIWDPEKDKTYKSNMQLEGDELEVEGCIAFLCDGQDWTRLN